MLASRCVSIDHQFFVLTTARSSWARLGELRLKVISIIMSPRHPKTITLPDCPHWRVTGYRKNIVHGPRPCLNETTRPSIAEPPLSRRRWTSTHVSLDRLHLVGWRYRSGQIRFHGVRCCI
ncbi:hypothetical protein SCLCIDRAFT_853916 [Scleroderma citrinum Foug A]|uniref:Uncharacterized protein n=1 Tax=Scleroderma citrinum Foug A TaxID=1036808 RepID=A0A0C3DMW2_9AGAM|nr:hypothetical protein SCLCIDRAFT_853916 [Scleroderma citrinum Foug A]